MADKEKPVFVKLEHTENVRRYIFPAGSVEVKGVTHICVRPSGTHRLETLDGKKWIIPAGWLAIEFDAADWTF